MSRRAGGVLAAIVILVTAAVAGCPGKDRPGETKPLPVDTGPDTSTREGFQAQLEVVRAAVAAGDPGAAEQIQQLGRDALAFPDAEPASAVAQLLLAQGRHDDALDYVAEAKAQYTVETGRKALLFPEAQAYDETGRPARAAEVFEQALEIPPNNPFEYAGLADLWVAADEFDRAEAVVEQGLAKFPADPIVLQARAEVALRRGDAVKALMQLDLLLAGHPDDVAIQVLRLEALAVLDRRDEARTAAEQYDALYPLLGHGAIILGLVRARDGDAEGAAEAWARAEARIATCEDCTEDQAVMLAWAREQAAAETVKPLDR